MKTVCDCLVLLIGFEPTPNALGMRCSIQLSYRSGDRGWIRTNIDSVRTGGLCPIELRDRWSQPDSNRHCAGSKPGVLTDYTMGPMATTGFEPVKACAGGS